jgi:type IV fimbrial biogenesis protein FimT
VQLPVKPTDSSRWGTKRVKFSTRFIESKRASLFSSRSDGFTLTELVVSIAIVAIMLAIGIPALRDLVVSQRVRGAANDLYSDLTYARAEAIKRNAQVRLVRASSSWSNGWSIQVGGEALRSQSNLPDVAYVGSADSSVTYNPDGRTTFSGATSFNFSAAGGGAVSMRCVVITPSGRPSVLVDGNRNGDCRDG